MLTIQSFGELTFNGQTVLVENDSGDFTASLNTAANVFELQFDKDMSKSIFVACAKDPYADAEPYTVVSAEREPPRRFRVATLKNGRNPEFIRGFGFWFIATRVKVCQDDTA